MYKQKNKCVSLIKKNKKKNMDPFVKEQVNHITTGVDNVRLGVKGLLDIINADKLKLIQHEKALREINILHNECEIKGSKLYDANLLLQDMNKNLMETTLEWSTISKNLKKENRICRLKLKYIKNISDLRKKRLEKLMKKNETTKIPNETLLEIINEEHAEDDEELTFGGGGGGGGDSDSEEETEEEKEGEGEYDNHDIAEALEIYSTITTEIPKEKLKKQSRLSFAKKAADLSRDLRHAINAVKSDKMPSVTFDNINDSMKILKFAHDRLKHFEDIILQLNVIMTRSNKLPAKLFEFKQELVKKIFQSEDMKILTDVAIKSRFYKTIGKPLSATYTAKDNDLGNVLSDVNVLYFYFYALSAANTTNEQLKKIYTDLLSGVKSNNNNNSSSSSSFKSSSGSSSNANTMKWNDFY